jgi:tetratricopeptide (TPR) repeat protein
VQRRQRTLDGLVRLVLRLSQTEPVLLVVDDLHWIDTETQAFLDRLVVSAPAARLAVVVSYRPEYTHGWSGKSFYTQLHLDPLATVNAEALIRSLVGGDVALDPLTRVLLERTEGNPFFLEESVRALAETGGLVGEPGAYRPARDLDALAIPPTVRAVLAARIDRLPSEEREILHAAAVVGKNVPLTLLQTIADAPAAAVAKAVATLQNAELLLQARVLPEVEYTFKHPLTHDVAYQAVQPDRRRALHARMVAALERVYADRLTDQVERLAHHAVAAESWSSALAYSRQAGAKAAWRSAHREAVRHFEQALAVLGRRPTTPATREETLDVHLQLRWSLVPLGEYAKLGQSLGEAAVLAEALDDRLRLGEISQSMTNYLRMMGDSDGALAAGRRARAAATAVGNRALEIRATYQLAMVYRQRGDHEDAIGAYQAVVEFLQGSLLYERFGEPSVLSVHARRWLAAALAEVGRFAEAITAGAQALQIAETANNTFSLATASIGLGEVHAQQGDLERAMPLLERGIALCRERNFGLILPHAASGLGAALTRAERVDEALPLLELAFQTATARGLMAGCSRYLSRLGEARLAAGATRDAHDCAARALDAARKYQERASEAWALDLLGQIAARSPSPNLTASAERHGAAIDAAQSLGMKPLVALCHERLGELFRRAGDPERARDHVTTARSMCREMGMMMPPLRAGSEECPPPATPGSSFRAPRR